MTDKTKVTKVTDCPAIGTINDPSFFSDGGNYTGDKFYLCYQVAPKDSGGHAVIEFEHVIEFSQVPINVEGLADHKFELNPWAINEISGDPKTTKWKPLNPRYWAISFMDSTIEIVFEKYAWARVSGDFEFPKTALKSHLSNQS